MQSIGAPRSGALALRSGAVLPERCRSATPGSWPGALSERRSGIRLERTWSASAPTALQQTVKFIEYNEKISRYAQTLKNFYIHNFPILVELLIKYNFVLSNQIQLFIPLPLGLKALLPCMPESL